MKHFKAHFERHHNVENGYWCNEYTGKDQETAFAEAIEECLIEHFCLEKLTNDEKELIKIVAKDGYSESANIQGYSLFPSYDNGIAIGLGDTPEKTEKYETVMVSVSFIKEQLETVTYIAQDEDIERLDDISIPETVEMGVFRYHDGNIKVEVL